MQTTITRNVNFVVYYVKDTSFVSIREKIMFRDLKVMSFTKQGVVD